MDEKSNRFRLGFISEKYLAELVAATGSEQFLEKGNRPYVGMYDVNSGWFVPLRANISEKKPHIARYLTPFDTTNPHFKNPGLDFQKAIYAPNEEQVNAMDNTLPKEQWQFIADHQDDISNKFSTYVETINDIKHDSPQYKMSTVPFFPDGIEELKIKKEISEQFNSFMTVEAAFQNQVDSNLERGNSADVEPAYLFNQSGKGLRIGYRSALDGVTAEKMFSDQSHLLVQPFEWNENNGSIFIDWKETSLPLSYLTANMPKLDESFKDEDFNQLDNKYEKLVHDYNVYPSFRNSKVAFTFATDDKRVLAYMTTKMREHGIKRRQNRTGPKL